MLFLEKLFELMSTATIIIQIILIQFHQIIHFSMTLMPDLKSMLLDLVRKFLENFFSISEIFVNRFQGNPWRCSFDKPTSRLFCGDDGQGNQQEIDIITAGANYGWPRYDGNLVKKIITLIHFLTNFM